MQASVYVCVCVFLSVIHPSVCLLMSLYTYQSVCVFVFLVCMCVFICVTESKPTDL